MRCFLLVIGLLCSMALPSWADEKQPAKAPPAYIKVEMRGTLRIGGMLEPQWLEAKVQAKQTVKASVEVPGMALPLAFEGKDLADLAKKLDKKTVVVVGYLSRVSDPLITVQPTQFVYYVRVTELKAAE